MADSSADKCLFGRTLFYEDGRLSGYPPALKDERLDPKDQYGFGIKELYDDPIAKEWLSGTSSYELFQGGVTRYVLKIPDLRSCKNKEQARKSVEAGNRRIGMELNTLRRAELNKVPVTPLLSANKETRLWVSLDWRNDATDKEPVQVDCIVREFIQGCTLREWCEHQAHPKPKPTRRDPDRESRFLGLEDVRKWFQVGWAIAQSLREVHRQRIVHGYLSPDNIIIGPARGRNAGSPASRKSSRKAYREALACLPTQQNIYFANTEQFARPSPELAMHLRLYDAPEKWKGDAESEWYSPADIFSFGMVLLYLAIGKNLEEAKNKNLRVFDKVSWVGKKGKQRRYKIENYGRLRESHELRKQLLTAILQRRTREAERDCESKFKLDTNVLEQARNREMAVRISTIVMDCIDPDIKYRAPSLRSVLRQMRLFSPSYPDFDPRSTRAAIKKSIEALRKIWAGNQLRSKLQEPETVGLELNLTNPLPPPLSEIVLTRLGLFLSDLDDLDLLSERGKRRSFRITAGRESLVETMVAVLSSVKKGCKCTALLTPTFWYASNMGEFGRVLRMLELAILAGADVEWIMVVNTKRFQQPLERALFRYQSELSHEWLTSKDCPKKIASEPLKYAVVDDAWYSRLNHDKLTHIWIQFPSPPELTIAPNYSGEGQVLTTLRMWVGGPRGQRREDYEKIFAEAKKVARPLLRYDR